NQDGSLPDGSAGDGDALTLASRERDSAFAEHGVVSQRKFEDELVSVRELGGGDDLLARGFWGRTTDVVPDARGKQQRVLKHHADLGSQRNQLVLPEIATINQHPP